MKLREVESVTEHGEEFPIGAVAICYLKKKKKKFFKESSVIG